MKNVAAKLLDFDWPNADTGRPMACNRFFMLGVVLLLFGIQFRMVESLVLNEKASQFIEKRIAARPKIVEPASTLPVAVDPVDDWWVSDLVPKPAKQPITVTPPKWLGWSLISVGAVMILTCPCFRS